MKVLRRSGPHILLGLLVMGCAVPGRSTPQVGIPVPKKPAADSASQPSAITRVRILLHADSPALEITSNGPLVPQVTKLDGPPRLMVDLPNALMSVDSKEIPVK